MELPNSLLHKIQSSGAVEGFKSKAKKEKKKKRAKEKAR